ncbi:NAD-glutamate dehydrogenase domain-containing protein [Gilvimarinus sp. DA14]|uniref:NAD-glutamate dehydrogenase domain-containing protein n=1 Tax=Gilvimarinus sp. DA14 TaxID=2956798 RepID=UPI0020B6A397|nr:NAD-glutamate dehydrogenase domain-containing protein [Gilvimarinus sp. DA14]UTF58881.1 NAD-glutamate dehydrogenase [Gilvimarinus sp. DA14]
MPNELKETFKSGLIQYVTDSTDSMLDNFFGIMPNSYFSSNDEQTILQHLSAILLANISGSQERIMLENHDASRQTYIHFGGYPGLLGDILQQIPAHKSIQQARAYTANDNSLVIDVFDFGQAKQATRHSSSMRRETLLAELKSPNVEYDKATRETLRDFVGAANHNYLARYSLAQLSEHARLAQKVRNTLDSESIMTPAAGASSAYQIAYAAGQVDSTNLFTRVARFCGKHGIDIRESYVENFDLNTPEQRTLLVLEVLISEPNAGQMSQFNAEINRLAYLDKEVLQVAFTRPGWSLSEAEVLVGLCHLADQALSATTSGEFSRHTMLTDVLNEDGIAQALARLVLVRFDSKSSHDFTRLHTELAATINDQVADSRVAQLFNALLNLTQHLLKANLYAPRRYALAFKVNPEVMVSQQRPQQAFGIFYVFGKAFDGFHVRFEDVARGGVRIVQPQAIDQHGIEVKRLFDEAYQLASAQQLKNKDIPEGGSKGVILVKPSANTMRCGKSYVDSLLDLILDNPLTQERRCDYYPAPELLFLGPDENVSDQLIEWIIQRAGQRGYPLPASFMSSKPGAGINHKAYGVTSEGVNVFLQVGLENIGIDPATQPFTVTMTGGPDGDVAGNLIRILFRDYPDTAAITGIADGSGCAEDPEGLARDELLRLVEQSLTIAHFDRQKLGPRGRVLGIDEPGGIEARNTLHCRLSSDVFVPAGGRPGTINEANAPQFIDAQGKPASKLIVEGANLFLTPKAREWLTRQGVFIVKDSSANKCGVICSSYEIAAGMMLNEAAFLQIKKTFVEEVKQKLRALALLEAKTLFREFYFQPDSSLAQLSMQLSQEIIALTNVIAGLIDSGRVPRDGVCRALLMEFFPRSLLHKAGDTALDKLPASYFSRAMASVLASRIVYHEGIRHLQALPHERLEQHLIHYLQQEEVTADWVRKIEHSNLPDKSALIELVKRGATGTGLKWG